MSEPILVILAAGMGSRYGGMKQIDAVGSNGESIIDFSIYDAIRAGFKKVVLIIKKEHEEAFKERLTNNVSKKCEVVFAYQELTNIPADFSVPEGRVKPWGTTHALLACKGIVDQPFMICNADDYYGPESFSIMYNFLKNEVSDSNYGMVGYKLVNTLTENGTVTRGLCQSENNNLTDIVEVQNIRKVDNYAEYEENGQWIKADQDALCSMNYWGFTPKIFEECEDIFYEFLKTQIAVNPLKCEHVIPTAVHDLIKSNKINVKVMATTSNWFGVTYQQDKPLVVSKLQALKNANVYPEDLWK